MSKYSKDDKQALIVKPVRFDQSAIDAVSEIHNNFSEFVRDALDEKIKKEQEILRRRGLLD